MVQVLCNSKYKKSIKLASHKLTIFIYAAETSESVHPVSVNNLGWNKTSSSLAKTKYSNSSGQWGTRAATVMNNPPDLPEEQAGPFIWKAAKFSVIFLSNSTQPFNFNESILNNI